MVTREEVIKTVKAVISELFPFLNGIGPQTHAVLLPSSPMSIGDQIAFIKRRYSKGFIKFAGYRDALMYYGDAALTLDYDVPTEGRSLLSGAARFADVTLISPSVELLRKLAKADESAAEVSLVLYALTHGKKVTVVTDFDISQITPGAFAKSMADVYAAVSDMGVAIVRSTSVDEENYDPMSGLLSEIMVRNAAKARSREIVVDEKTIVTPLARDAAEELGVKIRVKL